ncbi:unnamed protein product [Cuscuta campestris]|uniref:Non-structural maintenance of chromosomes element 4 n=1 Tax=Cuscuta campestris TaxID=132261 RepID=A0A484K4Q3_9ASTE|nr:unnamed protein product [Cuscuta campestris]
MATPVEKVKVEEGEPGDKANALSRKIDRLARIIEFTEFAQQPDAVRRTVRSQYSSIQNIINERSYDIGNSESERFKKILGDVEGLFRSVARPREQVADAETVFGLIGTLVDSVKSHLKGSVTPAEFVSCFLKNYGKKGGSRKNAGHEVPWKEIGCVVSPVFMDGSGCKTMLGPMNYKIKLEQVDYKIKPEALNYVINLRGIRNLRNEIKRARRTAYACPTKISNSTPEWKSNTERNVFLMFEVVEKKKSVKLENLVLNKISYAQTIENIFALSFLVKDGRVAISLAENGSHFVSTRSAGACPVPPSNAVNQTSIFRFDYIDWKMMLDFVPEGEELLMPHRVS